MIDENALLDWIWYLTLALALCSLAVLLVLVVRRSLASRYDRVRAGKRQEWSALMHAALSSPVKIDYASLPKPGSSDYPIILGIALDMIRTTRGGHVDDVIAMVDGLGLLAYLKSSLKSGRRSTRQQALTLLGYFPSDESVALLLKHFGEPDPYVQMTVLCGLARHADRIDVPAILHDLEHSLQTNALMLADILRRFGAGHLPALHDLARTVTTSDAPAMRAGISGRSAPPRAASRQRANESVRVAATIAIGNIGDLSSIGVLVGLLEDASHLVRIAAIEALGRIGEAGAAVHVAALLDDHEENVRIEAAQALGRLRNENTLPALLACLDDDAWWVRFRAAESLVHFGDTGIALLRASSANTDRQGEIATQVLAEMVPA